MRSHRRLSATFALLVALLSPLLLGCGPLSLGQARGAEATARALATSVVEAVRATLAAGTGEEPAAAPSGSSASGGISHDEPTATPELAADTGAIAGKVSYPSDFIPPLRVVAFATDNSGWYEVRTEVNQRTYVLEGLPPGTYTVVAYAEDADGQVTGYSAGYSQSVPCGLSVDCLDHTLIDVEVRPGETTVGIDPGDWYAPEGAFPPYPG